MSKKLKQLIGPFKKNESISISGEIDITYVQIGFQIPFTERMINLSGKEIPLDIRVNNQEYRINDTGILEFGDMAERELNITFLHDLPFEAIIDIAYEIQE